MHSVKLQLRYALIILKFGTHKRNYVSSDVMKCIVLIIQMYFIRNCISFSIYGKRQRLSNNGFILVSSSFPLLKNSCRNFNVAFLQNFHAFHFSHYYYFAVSHLTCSICICCISFFIVLHALKSMCYRF